MPQRDHTTLISSVGDDLCLAYANTLSWRGSTAPKERLHEFADLVGWIERTGCVPSRTLRPVRAWAREHPARAAKLFVDAIALRETIYRVFGALADGGGLLEQDFAALSEAIADAPVRRQLVRSGGRYGWRIDGLRPSLPHLLAPVLWSSGDLVLDIGRRRLRRCGNERCLWLFLDRSKSGTRRWCDMASCGNRAKARRHYLKVKAEEG